jgi:hypothetical protein
MLARHAWCIVLTSVSEYVLCASQLPIVTRSYVTFSFLTTAGCALEVRLGAALIKETSRMQRTVHSTRLEHNWDAKGFLMGETSGVSA